MGNAKTKLINRTGRDIEIREFLVVDPTEPLGNIYSSQIPLSARGAGATTRVNGRSYLHTGRQVSLLRIWCDGTYAQTTPLIANNFIASQTITITYDPENAQFVVR
ncbi:hypothetical protein RHGRI_005452 [Rhododendron griersonianum]|uniref:Uncharacterized protein n=1 Tax=Rhododendron griersonianum TaxID=479676 RepID=A0AAV6LEJ1_9ERIC|nr:hypothetical protein RHGRI_005452 [Rhododendron griersonianum]